MTATATPPAPVPEPPVASANPARFVSIRSSLLPVEITNKRRLDRLKRHIVVGLASLVALLVAWYAFAMLQTSQAKSNLNSAERTTSTLQIQQRSFGPLVAAQAQSAAIKTQLVKLMIGDIQWKKMLDTLRASATRGVQITSVSASMTSGAAPTPSGPQSGLGVLNQSGKLQVGTLTILGTAPDKNAVAAYIDGLAKIRGLAAPFPANVTGDKGVLTFTANVIITSDALGGRYATTQGGH
jgi:Tfp pilus assembly protein PilN